MKTTLLIAACLAAAAGAAQAQRVSKVNGNRLLALCSSKAVGDCDAYLAGIADALTEQHGACIPASVTGQQLRDVTLKLLHDQPEKRELAGGKLAVHAITTAFPCGK